jgi:hypothetical protein
MTHSEKQSWEQIRARGRERFVLCEGILRRGLPLGVVVTVVDYFTHSTPPPIWELAVKFALLTLASGFCVGIFDWESQERDYRKPTEDDDVA